MKVKLFIKKQSYLSAEFLDIIDISNIPRIGESIEFTREEGTFTINGHPAIKRYFLKVEDVVYTVKNTFFRNCITDMIACVCSVRE